MMLAGYKEWMEVFDENISKVWQNERKEFQKVAMLYGALDRELLNIRAQLEGDIKYLKGKILEKDVLVHKLSLDGSNQQTPNFRNKENEAPHSSYITKSNLFEAASPDLFHNINNISSANISSVDLTLSDEDKTHVDGFESTIQTSPTINNKHKRKFRKKTLSPKDNNCKKNIFQREFDHEMSVVEGTPQNDRTKNERSYIGTRERSELFPKKRKVKTCERKVHPDKVDSMEIDYAENSDDEPLQLTDLLNYINKEDVDNTDQDEKDNLKDNKQPTKKPKIVPDMKVEPVVRGKARKQLTGFSCVTCEKFYSNMNLSPEKLQKKMDECSKHRYKYKPPEETLPGFWDLSFEVP